ncbi:unnamed protein product [Cylicostephanus goldi]|uniref:Uncharacterized protein n=1 Tax=Cylicostephanus goldi TaxID=71465 RepID=A0A3P7QUA6_CYLGO|nr:unnamed protein product [Cylicostephanus goldi]
MFGSWEEGGGRCSPGRRIAPQHYIEEARTWAVGLGGGDEIVGRWPVSGGDSGDVEQSGLARKNITQNEVVVEESECVDKTSGWRDRRAFMWCARTGCAARFETPRLRRPKLHAADQFIAALFVS